MTIALIGIPSGLSLQSWQLKELKEKREFDYYEIKDNYLVLYWVEMGPSSTININLDLKSEIPGLYEAPASYAYLYYTNEYKNYIRGNRVIIEK